MKSLSRPVALAKTTTPWIRARLLAPLVLLTAVLAACRSDVAVRAVRPKEAKPEGQVFEAILVVHNSTNFDAQPRVYGKLSFPGAERTVLFDWWGPFLGPGATGKLVVPILVPCEVIAALPAGQVGAVHFEVSGIARLDVSCCLEKNLPFEHEGRVERGAPTSCGV